MVCGSVSTESFPGRGHYRPCSPAEGELGTRTGNGVNNVTAAELLPAFHRMGNGRRASGSLPSPSRKRGSHLQLGEQDSHINGCILLRDKHVFQKLRFLLRSTGCLFTKLDDRTTSPIGRREAGKLWQPPPPPTEVLDNSVHHR